MARRPRVWVRAALGVGVALALLLGAEGLLRLANGPVPEPTPVFEAPDTSVLFTEGGDRVVATYQNCPPRAEFPREGPEPRVAFLGGSTVRAGSQGLPMEWEFASLVGESLGVQAVNLGNPALDSSHLVRIHAELLRWRWEAVVVYAGHNDFGNTWWREGYDGAAERAEARTTSALERLWLFRTLRGGMRGARGGPDVPLASPRVPPMPPEQRARILDQLEANLRAMGRAARLKGVPLVLVTPVCNLVGGVHEIQCEEEGPCAAALWREAQALRESDPARAEALLWQALELDRPADRAPREALDRMRAVAAEEGALLVDAARDLPRESGLDVPAGSLFQDNLHLSALGHLEVAALVTAALRPVLAGEGPALAPEPTPHPRVRPRGRRDREPGR